MHFMFIGFSMYYQRNGNWTGNGIKRETVRNGNTVSVIETRVVKQKQATGLFQARHFKCIAGAIKGCQTREQIITSLIKVFKADNERFLSDLFVQDCK